MNKSRKIVFVIALLLVLTIIGAVIIIISTHSTKSGEVSEVNDGRFTVVTSFYPMYIAALNVTDGADINLYNLSEPQTGCLHDYQLTTDDMKLLSAADVFVVNGGGMEAFLSDVTSQYPDLTIVDTSLGVAEVGDGEPRALDNDSSSEETDNAHYWISISNYIIQVENIAAGLSAIDMANADLYGKNATVYVSKLKKLQYETDTSLGGAKVVLFSEAYEYLAKDFGLDVRYVLDLDEEKDISARELADTIDVVKSEAVPVIIAEKQYGEKMANAVMEETDVMSVYLDTIIRGDYDKNEYINRMKKNIELLKGALIFEFGSE